jgi:hypothetical protein
VATLVLARESRREILLLPLLDQDYGAAGLVIGLGPEAKAAYECVVIVASAGAGREFF